MKRRLLNSRDLWQATKKEALVNETQIARIKTRRKRKIEPCVNLCRDQDSLSSGPCQEWHVSFHVQQKELEQNDHGRSSLSVLIRVNEYLLEDQKLGITDRAAEVYETQSCPEGDSV